MRTLLAVTMIALFSVGIAYAEKEFTYDKKDDFDGSAVKSITVDMDRGDIKIEKARGQNIEVFYKNAVFARNQSEADEINADFRYSAKVDGRRLTIVVETPRHGQHGKGIVERIIEGDWDQEGSYPMVKLAIPDDKAVEILSASSDIDVSELSVDLNIESASSDITIENTRGKFECDISSGDINVTGHKGQISVKGKSSDIRITDVEGEVDARSSSGDIVIEKARGTVRASTISGDGRLIDIDGDVEIEAASGDLAGSSITGSLRAAAVSGDVMLDGLSAKEGDYDVTSVSGDIHMEISRDFGGDVSLRSISGSVNSHLSGDIESYSDSRMEGRIGQGKGRLSVATTSGDITINGY